MTRRALALSAVLSGLLLAPLATDVALAQEKRATLTIRAGEPGAKISRHLYGHFAEHLGRCINDGDYVMVNPKQDPHDKDIVAARLGEEATVKTYTRQGGAVVLEAANPADRDIRVEPGMDFGILGVICGVFRPGFDAGPSSQPIQS